MIAISVNGSRKNNKCPLHLLPILIYLILTQELQNWLTSRKGRKGSFALIIKREHHLIKHPNTGKLQGTCMNISSWEIITLLFHKWGKAEEENAAGDHRLSRNPAGTLFPDSISWPRISLNDLPLLTGEFMGASGSSSLPAGTFSQNTQPLGCVAITQTF